MAHGDVAGRIVDFMGDAAGELTDRRELAGVDQLSLSFL